MVAREVLILSGPDLVAVEKKGQLRCASHNLDFWTFSFCQLLVESYLLSVLIVICLMTEADYLYLLCSPTSSD